MLLILLTIIFSTVMLFGGFALRKRLLAGVCGCVICYHIVFGVIYCLGYRLLPSLWSIIEAVLLCTLICVTFISLRKYRFAVLLAGMITAVAIVFSFVFGSFYVYKSVDGVRYVGASSKLSGVTETTVEYYKRYGIAFVSTKSTFTEYYGRVLGGYGDIASMEPYEIKYGQEK